MPSMAHSSMMSEFLNLMVDPFVDGRLGSGVGVGGGQAIGFAPDAQAILPPDIALAYAGVLKSPPPAPFEQRWTAWGGAYGGGNWTNGNTATVPATWPRRPTASPAAWTITIPRTPSSASRSAAAAPTGACRRRHRPKRRVPDRRLWHDPLRPGLFLRGACLRQSLDDHQPHRARRSADGKLRCPELRRAHRERLSLRRRCRRWA